MDRYGHFSFLTPALLEPADLVLPTTAPTLASDGFLKFLDQDLGDVSWVSTGCWKMVFVIKAYLKSDRLKMNARISIYLDRYCR